MGYSSTERVTIVLSDPIATVQGLLFDRIWISSGHAVTTSCPSPSSPTYFQYRHCRIGGKGYPVPATNEEIPSMVGVTPAIITPTTIGGQWELVGSKNGEVVVIMRLHLVDFPPGHLTGSLSSTVVAGYGTPSGGNFSFNVVGHAQDKMFMLTVENGGNTSASGGLGKATPYGATRIGCSPLFPAQAMFLVINADAFVFYRPQSFLGVSLGQHIPLYTKARPLPCVI